MKDRYNAELEMEELSPLALDTIGETSAENYLLATLRILVAKGEVSESDVMKAWKFVIG